MQSTFLRHNVGHWSRWPQPRRAMQLVTRAWDEDGKYSSRPPSFDAAAEPDRAALFVNDALRHPQPESCAPLSLRRKERFE